MHFVLYKHWKWDGSLLSLRLLSSYDNFTISQSEMMSLCFNNVLKCTLIPFGVQLRSISSVMTLRPFSMLWATITAHNLHPVTPMASFNNIHTLKAKGEASGTSRSLLAQLPWNNHAQKLLLWDCFTSKKNMAGAFFLAQGTAYSSCPTNFITEKWLL